MGTKRRRLRLSIDAREALAFLGGMAGIAWLLATRNNELVPYGVCLTMMGGSAGWGWDRRARERRERQDDPR